MAEMLQIDRWDLGGSAWLVLAGELDRVQVGRHAARIRALSRGPELVLDLRRLAFIDLGGLRFLAALVGDSSVRGARIRVILSAPVRHLAEAAHAPEVIAASAEPADVLAEPAGAPAGIAPAPPPGLGRPPTGAAVPQAASLRLELEEVFLRTQALHLRAAYLARRGRHAAGQAEQVVTATWDARQRRVRALVARDGG